MMEIKKIDQSFTGSKSIFYIEGEIHREAGKQHMYNQMFVEAYFPVTTTKPYPVVMFHGAGQTNVNWLMTPDGRMGWADYFVSKGYEVYLCEQPSRGRSAYHPEQNGPRIYHSLESLQRFMGSTGRWPQSKLHTQWPGEGSLAFEDETDRQFIASQVEYLPSNKESQRLMLETGTKLLRQIGPAILLTHSQAGPFGWLLADACPELVKGIMALEPSGPPFTRKTDAPVSENFGITDLPLHYEPEITSPADIRLQLLPSETPGINTGWIFQEPAPQLPRLSGIPIWIVVSESSYHAGYDHLTSRVLEQCGVPHQFVRLEDKGIHGNGHMMMLEKNHLEVADLILQLLAKAGL
ncbi:MAG: alpha/beta hydrolase [Erysipelotrichaceae bacterium]|nr:alpha/beta hydrolase [Erysipelotrichaceae bacterium]MDO5122815.1 alpha/beta hydrolase [Erysipelotrichaceae bacterium]